MDADERGERRSGGRLVPFTLGLLVAVIVIAAGVGIALYYGAVAITLHNPAGLAEPTPPPPAAAEAPAAPRLAVTKTASYGDWAYVCVRLPDGEEERCSISQQLFDAKTKAPVFLWRIVQDGKGGLVGEWQTRTGVMVNHGIVLDAGTEKPATIPLQGCTSERCQATANLAEGFITALAKTEKATVTIFPIGGPGLRLSLSVKGLPEALAALQR